MPTMYVFYDVFGYRSTMPNGQRIHSRIHATIILNSSEIRPESIQNPSKSIKDASRNRFSESIAKKDGHGTNNGVTGGPLLATSFTHKIKKCSKLSRKGTKSRNKLHAKNVTKVDAEQNQKRSQKAPNMIPKMMPKQMKHRCDFGTCDFLFFVESITLKSFFPMIWGDKNQLKINKRSM